MKPSYVALVLVLCLTFLIPAQPLIANESEPENVGSELPTISAYWHPRVRQWEPLIVTEAQRRALDPDFVAALVWKESRGYQNAVGPVGAVGLMQVMPKEAGFDWRPSQEALFNPETNLFWGTRTLATVVKQGQGDVFNALAAYNGGWEQIQYRGPRLFATEILRDYAQVVALRHNLRAQDGWIAIFAVIEDGVRGPIWVSDVARSDVYFYSNVNWVPEGYPLIPRSVAPVARLAHCEEEHLTYEVGVWLYLPREHRWVTP